jgi:hypothetical protein
VQVEVDEEQEQSSGHHPQGADAHPAKGPPSLSAIKVMVNIDWDVH